MLIPSAIVEEKAGVGPDRGADIPPLENGDHLTRAEFERRYSAMPAVKKAELVEGEVYMGSPVRHSVHSAPHARVMWWLGTYCVATAGVDIGDNATVRLDADNEVQPDALLRLEPGQGGHSVVAADGYLEGAPELIFEVAASSASYDLHEKKQVYRRNGVPEYAVWRVYEEALDWFRLENEQYVRVEPNAEGVIESRVFPGLRLHVTALLKDDLPTVLAELKRGLASPEHAAFVSRLAGGTPPPSTDAA